VCVCDWGLNSGLHICKAGTLLLRPPFHFAPVVLEIGGLMNCLPRVALKHDPPKFRLSSVRISLGWVFSVKGFNQ
jgi:hypothetical protein